MSPDATADADADANPAATAAGTAVVDYAAYVPPYRLPAAAYDAWNGSRARIDEKRVPGFDEDAVTMAIEAATALDRDDSGVPPVADVDTLALASTTWPQPGTTASGTLVTALGLSPHVRAVECGTSWRAGLEALALAVDAGSGLAVVADAPTADPAADVEHLLGAGAVAVRTARTDAVDEPVARVLDSSHYTAARVPGRFLENDVDDARGAEHGSRGGHRVVDLAFGQETTDAYAEAVGEVVESLLAAGGHEPADVAHAVLPQEDVKTAWRVGSGLGFEADQMRAGFVVDRIGFAGAAGSPLGLAAALDAASPGDRLVVASYGHGHGATGLLLEAGAGVERVTADLSGQLDGGEELSYTDYLRQRGAI
jgi:3-hydroxy-3-methylglutaryl CoA synthase